DWSVETTEGVIMEATFRGPRLVAVQFTPLKIIGRLQPVFLPADQGEGRAVLKRMTDATAHLEGRREETGGPHPPPPSPCSGRGAGVLGSSSPPPGKGAGPRRSGWTHGKNNEGVRG